MNTIENNKIIAEFMGYEIAFGNTSEPCIIGKQNACTPLKFHSDWNWLMEVVEKIEKTRRSKWSKYTFACVKISSLGCQIIFYGNREEIISDVVRPYKMEAVYDACLKFIKWYNEQKS